MGTLIELSFKRFAVVLTRSVTHTLLHSCPL